MQVGPHFLAVNHLQPYPHWQSFKSLIFDNLHFYRRVANPTGFKRIGLRYINRIATPETSLDFRNISISGRVYPITIVTVAYGYLCCCGSDFRTRMTTAACC